MIASVLSVLLSIKVLTMNDFVIREAVLVFPTNEPANLHRMLNKEMSE